MFSDSRSSALLQQRVQLGELRDSNMSPLSIFRINERSQLWRLLKKIEEPLHTGAEASIVIAGESFVHSALVEPTARPEHAMCERRQARLGLPSQLPCRHR